MKKNYVVIAAMMLVKPHAVEPVWVVAMGYVKIRVCDG